ncbi:hypothetical protein O181_038549 [Austropuccinia psidii MF-1]|uniref:Uncharacterized protein n=1 Tax=Austropuccinia psidii MF-1 TaxID=1389203 RepID=A0A9Q3HDN7_9BASI|nr:hypothetical protein [Austropuccinia psidii MF-1]
MDLDQDKIVSPEERHKWKMPELSPAPLTLQKLTKLLFLLSDLNHFQQATIEIYQSRYKNWFMAAKPQEWEFLPSIWIGTMNSYFQVKNFMGPEKTEGLLRGWKPMSCKGKVQQIKAWSNNQSMLSEDQKKKLAQGKDKSPVEAPQASRNKICLNNCQTRASKPQRTIKRERKRQRERQSPSGRKSTHRATKLPRKRRQAWTMCSMWQEL